MGWEMIQLQAWLVLRRRWLRKCLFQGQAEPPVLMLQGSLWFIEALPRCPEVRPDQHW